MKSFIIGLIAAVGISTAHADWKPSKSVNFLIGFGAGGSTDTTGRVIASEIERLKGWNIVPQNKPGGGGVAMWVGLNKTGKTDGTSIGMGVTSSIQAGLASKGAEFPVQLDDLTYIGSVSFLPSALVARGDAPYNNIHEFIEWSKSNGGKGVIVSQAADQQALIDMINKNYGLNIKSFRAKGGANAMKALLGGDADMIISSGPHVSMLKDGKVKVINPVTHARHGYAPEKKTLLEEGVPFAVTIRFFLALPKDTDAEIQQEWAKTLEQAIETDAVKSIISKLGGTIQNLGVDGIKKDIEDGVAVMKQYF